MQVNYLKQVNRKTAGREFELGCRLDRLLQLSISAGRLHRHPVVSGAGDMHPFTYNSAPGIDEIEEGEEWRNGGAGSLYSAQGDGDDDGSSNVTIGGDDD
jgi:hypothetical protein